ncbi:DUF6770 family protein [Ferruginibacter sp. SUN106]|uniref:DUF6770 family protein n=1 Tax=Ferruginibacter sp. SUN106 TaxID=2978348 RepID=UPI003D36138A
MRKLIVCLTICLCATVVNVKAQSKVFQEVNEDISSEMKIITQDEALVGYLVFTQLEKASEDSFNYKITLMDENLNDIGTVNFREEKLDLDAVSFEQDILCLAYLKSNINGKVFKNRKEYNAFDAKNAIFTQFLTLDGKIIKTNTNNISLKSADYELWASPRSKFTYYGGLTHRIQLKNISQKGFACFYGDKDGCNLISYDLTGKELWKKSISEEQAYSLLTSKADIYLLQKVKEKYYEGGYSLLSYNAADGKAYDKIALNDKEGNSLKVLSFANDPVTGTPYLSGSIIDQDKGNNISNGKQLAKGPYSGVFVMDVKGHTKTDIKQTFTYWGDGSQKPAISKRGYISDAKSYAIMTSSFRDYNGNTYFTGSEFVKKAKIGSIVSSIIFLPLVTVTPIILAVSGTTKCKVTDVALMKLNPKGSLSFETEIPCEDSKYLRGVFPLNGFLNQRSFYSVDNANTKANYMIVDDSKNIMIYNVNQKKIVRTVPHKDGKIRTYIFPAKEGHIMVVENNKKEKYTRLSIEALN